MLNTFLKHVVRGLIVTPVVMAVVAGGILAFTAPKSPPATTAVEKSNATMIAYEHQLPPYKFFTARDGNRMGYHLYPGRPGGGVVVAIHGSSGSSLAVHGIAESLAARGMTVYALDLRGHGLSLGPNGKLGDVVYRGQYEDDIDDLVQVIKREHPGEKRLLLGHSTGGSVILRTAASRYAGNFDGYLALSPFIAAGTAMDRPNEGGWTVVSIPRIVVLSILNRFGISAFDHLRVLAMAVPEKDAGFRPRFYTHALLASANLPRDWKPSIAAIHAPTQVLIGSDDELFHAEAYPAALRDANPAIKVTLIPGVGHMAMVYDPRALQIETDTAQAMLAK